MGRQERRQIGAVMGARNDEDGNRDAAEPNDEHTRAAHIHGSVDGRRVISGRSPSGGRISTLSNWSPAPSMRTWLTDCLTFDSSGTSVNVQHDTLPAKSSRNNRSSALRSPASVARMLSTKGSTCG